MQPEIARRIKAREDLNSHQLRILEFAERRLLPKGLAFDDERIEFIFNHDLDLVACAGSGKTTALAAKLLILEDELPLGYGRGICVLTHTNVAVDEIKTALGVNSSLQNYPHFIGTIQEFVDRFLAVPAYKAAFKKNPVLIDSEIANQRVVSKFYSLSQAKQKSLRRLMGSRDVPDWISKLVLFFPSDRGHTIFKVKSSNGLKTISGNDETERYKTLRQFRFSVLSEGYITFDDTYSLANWYLDKYPWLKEIISERFQYLFVDEMQDTAAHQLRIISRVFSERTNKQYLGDPNQSIYEDDYVDGTDLWPMSEDYMVFEKSMRFPKCIADAISPVRVDKSTELIGVRQDIDIKPYIIVFKKEDEASVVNSYIEILEAHKKQLKLRVGDKIKIIGLNGKTADNEDKLTIPSYINSYLPSEKKSFYFDSLADYIVNSNNPNAPKPLDFILTVVCRYLNISGAMISGRRCSPASFSNYIKELDNSGALAMEHITRLSLLHGTKYINSSIKSFLLEDLAKIIEHSPNNESRQFLDLVADDVKEGDQTKQVNVAASITVDDYEIPITVSSIHGVKGETHKSTLFLETKYRKHDLETIFSFIGEEDEPSLTATDQKLARLAYVGMSRASHLLCIAIREDHWKKKYQKQDWGQNWNIVNS